MLTASQNQIVYLMFITGILFLGLNFVACSMVFPGPPGSKRLGYVLIVGVLLAYAVMHQLRILQALEFTPGEARKVILLGFATPVFLISLVYYRIKKARLEKTPDGRPPANTHDAD